VQNERNPLFATTIEMEYHFEQKQVGARERGREGARVCVNHVCLSACRDCVWGQNAH